jgi:Family of unknown function (DUF6308)
MADIRIRRIGPGPVLVVEQAEQLVAHFLRYDASAQPGGYDDLAGHGERDRITRSDVVAINTTMRARSPHTAWDSLINDSRPLPWLAGLDPAWDLVTTSDELWQSSVRTRVDEALVAATGPGRGISVGSKVLHLKRPGMFPVLDSLVLQQLGVTESVPMIRVVEHLRAEGTRNLAALREVQAAIAPRQRSLVRLLDIILWASHPAAGLGPSMSQWEHRFRPDPAAPATRATAPPASQPERAAPPPASTSTSAAPGGRGRSFDDIWACILGRGTFRAVSTRGTEYRVTAQTNRAGQRVLVARPASGAIYVHADCFGQDITCQGTRAGGIYKGSPSVWDC